jgi:hypothetical protein
VRLEKRRTVGDRGVEPSGVSDRVTVLDAVGHPDCRRDHLLNQVIDLRRRPTRVEHDQQRRVADRSERVRERSCLNNDSAVRVVEVVLEDDQLVVAVPGEMTY